MGSCAKLWLVYVNRGFPFHLMVCAGEVTTLAGSGTAGWLDGVGTASRFSSPWDVSVDFNGAVFVADRSNS